MQPSEAICKTCVLHEEWCGWCPECKKWKGLHDDLRDFGVCRECRESLIDLIWDRTDALLESVGGIYRIMLPHEVGHEAREIREMMKKVMGA